MFPALKQHFTRCFVAGVVALLPLVSTALMVVYLETQIASFWLGQQGYYFFGSGLIAAILIIYLIGLVVSTLIGRWIWKRIDGLLDSLPALGRLYQTLKQIVGYGDGPEGVFQRTVLVPSRENQGYEIGLVTYEHSAAVGTSTADAAGQSEAPTELTVYLPGAPNPAAGRLIVIGADQVRNLDVPAADVLRSMVSVGTLPLEPSET